MHIDVEMRNIPPEHFKKNWGWFLGCGMLLSLLGIIAIGAAWFTTLLSVVVLGGILLVTGAVILINSFHYWWTKETGFSWNFITGCLYALFGLLLIMYPIAVAATITLILGGFLVVIGIARILYTQRFKFPGWGWNLLSGGLALLLGILIILQWPASGFIIGLFIGIDLFFMGWSYIMLALLAKNAR